MNLAIAILLLWAPVQDTPKSTFTPISAGNVLDQGTFRFEIPEGCFYAAEDNVHHMFKLTGADYIPNCVGIFFSAGATWEYSIAVQYVSDSVFMLKPLLPEAEFKEIFAKTHLYASTPIEAGHESSFVMTPTYDRAQNSFSIGIRYQEPNGEGSIFAKKIWVSDRDALIFSLRATDSSFFDEQEEIAAVFDSVTVNDQADVPLPENKTIVSYLELMGLQPNLPQAAVPQAQEPPTGMSPKVLKLSIVLAAVAVLLALGAIIISKRQVPVPAGEKVAPEFAPPPQDS